MSQHRTSAAATPKRPSICASSGFVITSAPVLGAKRIDEITSDDLHRLIDKLTAKKLALSTPSTSSRAFFGTPRSASSSRTTPFVTSTATTVLTLSARASRAT
jgi:hypothetical protein